MKEYRADEHNVIMVLWNFVLDHLIYSVDRVDVAQEMDRPAEWAALACSARLAHRSISSDIHPIHTACSIVLFQRTKIM